MKGKGRPKEVKKDKKERVIDRKRGREKERAIDRKRGREKDRDILWMKRERGREKDRDSLWMKKSRKRERERERVHGSERKGEGEKVRYKKCAFNQVYCGIFNVKSLLQVL